MAFTSLKLWAGSGALAALLSPQLMAAVVAPGTELASRQELVRNNVSEPASLDPQKVESDVEFNLVNDFFDGLLAVNPDGSLDPRLAARWETKDNRVWIFHLRPELKWSDGSPLTAADVVWSWQRLVDPATQSPYASYLDNAHVVNAAAIANGKAAPTALGIKALDATTIEVTLDQPVAYFMAMAAHPSLVPVDRKVIEKWGDRWTQPQNFVGSGAYLPQTWVVNEKIVAQRNPNYWDNAHTVINKVTYLPISSDTAEINRYRAGEIDITSVIAPTQFAALKRAMPEQVKVSPMLGTYYYEFNTNKPPFSDPRVRQALNLALDKQTIADKVMGQGQQAAWLVSQPHIGGVTLKPAPETQLPLAERIAKAKALLAAAGFDTHHPLSFNLLYNTSESHQRIAIAASSMWRKNLGVEAKLQNQEWKTLLETMHSGNYQLVRYAWLADYEDASTFLNNFQTGNSQNTSGYSNPQFDTLLAQAAVTGDAGQRGAIYQQAEDLLARDVPSVPVYHYVRAQLVKPWVGGYALNKLNYNFTRNMYIIKH